MNRHYEVVFLVHPDQSEQTPNIIQRCRTMIETNDGQIHRLEDWGRRSLAYPIRKTTKAQYILMNIECNDKILTEIKHYFHFNEAILRSLVLRRKHATTTPSAVMRSINGDKEKTFKGTPGPTTATKESSVAKTRKTPDVTASNEEEQS